MIVSMSNQYDGYRRLIMSSMDQQKKHRNVPLKKYETETPERKAQILGFQFLASLGNSPQIIEKVIQAWQPLRRTAVYFGPAADTSPIYPMSQEHKYARFVYVDSKPSANGFYGVNTLPKLWTVIATRLKNEKIAVVREFHDPPNHRHVMLLEVMARRGNPRPRPEKLVLEYFYDTPFDRLETRNGRATRKLLMCRLKTTDAALSTGAPVPQFKWATHMPKVKYNFGINRDGFVFPSNRPPGIVDGNDTWSNKRVSSPKYPVHHTKSVNNMELLRNPSSGVNEGVGSLGLLEDPRALAYMMRLSARENWNVKKAREEEFATRMKAGLPPYERPHPTRKKVFGMMSAGRNGANMLRTKRT